MLTEKDEEIIDNLSMPKHYSKNCLALFDFTPDNVFLRRGQVKFVDPKAIAMGIPILDLSAFAGCARDVYNLPESETGYGLIKSYCLNELASKLSLSLSEAEAVWNFGRGIQFILGAAFRADQDTQKTRTYLDRSLDYFRRLK